MKLKTLTVLGLFLTTSAAIAGEGHSHGPGGHSHGGTTHSHESAPISEDQAKNRSQEELARLVKKGKLDASWLKSSLISSEKKVFKGKEEWLVVYKNESSDKKNLFVFLSASGKFIAANHSGK